MRIGGIASGMDTEQIVSDLMRVERMRVDRLFQQEQRLKWRQEAYNDINRKMANFILDSRKAFGLTTTTSSGAMLSSSVNSLKWVKKATSSNESAVKVTANANAMAGTHTVKVEQLAEVARVTTQQLTETIDLSGAFTIELGESSKTITLSDAKVKGGEIDITSLDFRDHSNKEDGVDNRLTFSINGTVITLDDKYDDVGALKNAIQDQLPEGIEVSLNDDKLVFDSKKDIFITASGQGDLTDIGLVSGTTRANNTIDYIVKEINNAVDADGKSLGLRAAFDKDIGKLMITTRDTGEQEIIIKDDTTGVFDNADRKKGQVAKIKFNGVDVTKSTNNFSIYGINLQIDEADPLKEITIRVDSDVDSIFDKIKSFVDEYNKMIDDINGQLGQKYYRDFPPLTSEQKEAMTEKDIELWEEKAKSGLIRNDDSLTRILQTMRINLYGDVEGVSGDYNNITQIGITTGRYQDGGKLVINEEKLRAAINDDPEGIMDLLFKTPDSSVAEGDKTRNTGLVQRIYDTMIDGMKEVVNKSGPGEDSALLRSVRSNILIDFVTKQSSISLLDKDLDNINNRIAREEDLLLRKENRYWQRFTAMEKALSAMQQQSMWLMTQMGLQ